MARVRSCPWMAAAILLVLLPAGAGAQFPIDLLCETTVVADIVAFDQVFFWNRLGAVQPQGMMYALRRDVMPISGTELTPGNVQLRPDKRPRPLVLRVGAGGCLQIEFQNLLSPTRRDQEQPATRWASVHVVGMQPKGISSDGSFVGLNGNSIVDVGDSATYVLRAPDREGEHVMYSAGATTGGQGDGGSTNSGLFGAVIVEPASSTWYRSQITREDLDLATTGFTVTGFRVIEYKARYPTGHPREGQPILNMVDGGEIVHSDLTAIIAGRNEDGSFSSGTFPANLTLPNRDQPFREFVTIYHDEIGAVQAFPQFADPVLEHTLQGGRDGFAINYGAAGIGAEILANRFGVGPMGDCAECKFEEFFLSSWTVGDPAMIVDTPANSPCMVSTTSPNTVGQDPQLDDDVDEMREPSLPYCQPTPGRKATKAFFPDDPSNVYHSYLRDHLRFRVLHAGSKEHHIHHLHAHQWLFTGDSDKSSYLDSQAFGPGSSFTAEIAYEGGGNRNLTVGDSIFHCHFYPHFAQGMWSLWRVHDVFEEGTELDEDGIPDTGSRALPDGEILAGTPIPAVVPIPGKPMAPLPGATASINNSTGQVQISGTGNPGYPFFVPAVAGHRPPKPPLDTIHDGGLPRHIIVDGTFDEAHTRLDFHKTLLEAEAVAVPENGTAVEQAAMTFHEQSGHGTCKPDGTCDTFSTLVRFETNGQPRIAGAPYADPCPVNEHFRCDDETDPEGFRCYKAADIQTDVRLNKKAWHFPQQRFSALWEDVDDFLDVAYGNTRKPPEPLFFRANSNDCIEFWLTNLVPGEYALDDFQVRTPTDVLGQHIHLVKFDVTSSDGAGNGFNYEDGSFSPDEVRERIEAIREFNNCTTSDPRDGTIECPVAEAHPFFGPGDNDEWLGAQTTVQRWWADPVLDNNENDRTLRTVFTHDHFGPSTHQQAGLYAGLVVEKTGSTWKHNETGTPFYTRDDGGPTSWQAVITAPGKADYREFLLAFGDFQLAYEEGSLGCRPDIDLGMRCDDPDKAVNPPGREEIGLPDLLDRPDECPGGVDPPCPEIISAADPGMMSVNYRNEPIALRVRNPTTNDQAAHLAGDLSYAFSSIVDRDDNDFDVQPNFYAPLTDDLLGGDPFTPVLRAYENDPVQIRLLVGSHEEGHNVSVHGIKWQFEPSEPDSGFKNSQMMGISEHFEFIVPPLIQDPLPESPGYVDRLYSVGSATDDYWAGNWGILRTYEATESLLQALPDKPTVARPSISSGALSSFGFSCPLSAPVRSYHVTAFSGPMAFGYPGIVYNDRTDGAFGPLFDPTSIVYVRTDDYNNGTMTMEPLILRARAGECVKITLHNKVGLDPDLDGFNTLPMIMPGFNANDIEPSAEVGLHPQLLHYDVSRFDGANIGANPAQTLANAVQFTYEWYAGDVTISPTGTVTATPIEFGATNLISSDRIEHASKGAIGALIIEPENATWVEGYGDCDQTPTTPPTPCSRAVADVYIGESLAFREIVLLFQNDINMRTESELELFCPNSSTVHSDSGFPLENLHCEEDPEDTGQKAINYRAEPLWKRMEHAPGTPLEQTRDLTDWFDVVANSKVGADPETPVFYANAATPIRFRVLQPGGHARNEVFALHGHPWFKEPYINDSEDLGQNNFTFFEGARMGHGPTNHFDALLWAGAGGPDQTAGDYLFRDQASFGFDHGLWGIFRVCAVGSPCP